MMFDPARVRALARPPHEAEDFVTAPMTPEGIADLRERAKSEPWPWSKLLAAHADWQAANREAFEVAGDAEAESAAILRRAAAGDAIRQESSKAAGVFLTSFGFALELEPKETRRLFRRLMRKETNRAANTLRKEFAEAIVTEGVA